LRSVLRLFKKEEGFSLPVVLGASGFVALIIAFTHTMSDNRGRQKVVDAARSGRTSLLLRMEKLVANPVVLYTSMQKPENNLLKSCAEGRSCPADRKIPFSAWAPVGVNNRAVQISGKSGAGTQIDYDRFGRKCSQDSCFLRVRSYFKAYCVDGGSRCNQTNVAHKIIVRTEITQTPNRQISNKVKFKLQRRPFDREEYREEVFVTDINQTFQQCLENSSLTGVAEDGKITCVCNTGFFESGKESLSERPICQRLGSSTCLNSEYFAGYRQDGRIICSAILETTKDREQRFRYNERIKCRNDSYRIVKMKYASAAGCTLSGATGPVNCPSLLVTCHKFEWD